MNEAGSKLPQVLAAVLVNLSSLMAGCAIGWTSPCLHRLKQPGSFLPITDEEASWIGSSLPLGAIVGPFAGGFLADKIGRKWTLLSMSVPFLITWLLIILTQSIAMIYAARIIAGLALGVIGTVVSMYVGEIAEDSIRGSLTSLYNVIMVVGYFYEFVLGAFVSYTWLAIASILLSCTFTATFVFMPESPYYLLSQGKTEEASRSLQWLRMKSCKCVATELNLMQKSVDESKKSRSSIKESFATHGNIKALYLTCILIAFNQLTGINAVVFYATDVFKDAGESIREDDISTMIVGAVFMVSGFFPLLFIDRVGRRKLIFISATGMAIAQIVLGFFFYLEKTKDLSSVQWLPILCIAVNFQFFCIGVRTVPFILMGEIFPANVKSLATSISSSCNWLNGFLVTKLFPDIVSHMGPHIAFWIFALFCILEVVFVYFLLPETKGKSFKEIQDILNKK